MRKTKLDDFEVRAMVNTISELRNQLIAESKPTEDADILLQRLIR